MDRKYTFHVDQLPQLLALLHHDYKVLSVEGKTLNRYKSLYYDTPDYQLYMHHHNGKANRYKIRHRQYLENATEFFEIKLKNNKGRTLKSRINATLNLQSFEEAIQQFVTRKTPYQTRHLLPVLWVNYKRITLVGIHHPERVTIDVDLEFVHDGKTITPDNLVIAEIKQDKLITSPFLKVLNQFHIREGSISKYCMGLALTNTSLKKNNFKSKLLNLSKLL